MRCYGLRVIGFEPDNEQLVLVAFAEEFDMHAFIHDGPDPEQREPGEGAPGEGDPPDEGDENKGDPEAA